MAQDIFTIDYITYLPNSDNGPGCAYQISSEHDGVIKGFLANLDIKAGKRELEFQLREFNARLTATSRQWETRSHSKNAPTDHRGNQAKRRRKRYAATAS